MPLLTRKDAGDPDILSLALAGADALQQPLKLRAAARRRLVVRFLQLRQTEPEREPGHVQRRRGTSAGPAGGLGSRVYMAATLFICHRACCCRMQQAPALAGMPKNKTHANVSTEQGWWMEDLAGQGRASGSRTDSVQKVQRKCAQVPEKCT